MAKTLLQAVNEVLKRVGIIHGDSGLLTNLTSTARQRSIDIAVQVINEGIDELYTACGKPLPLSQAENTITLATSDRDYVLATDLVQLRWPMIDKTNNQFLFEKPGGYHQILLDDPEQDDTGLPYYAAISPVTGQLYMDRLPTSAEHGRVYTYQYDKELELGSVSDEVPFGNTTFRAMVPVWEQVWRRIQQKDFDADMYRLSMGRAARTVTRQQPSEHYCPR